MRGKLDRSRKRQHDKDAQAAIPTLELVLAAFKRLVPVRAQGLSPEQLVHLADCQCITAKPMLFVCNIGEGDLAQGGNRHSASVKNHADKVGARATLISGKIESELSTLPKAERAEFMASLGMNEPGVDSLVKAGYDLLGLASYFTAGVKEVRAWQIQKGWKAPRAAGVIHTDFEKGFIRAEVAAYGDYVAHRGEKGCREAGRLRTEGKDYVVQDGDVMHFLTGK